MCACYEQIPPIEETSILLSRSLHFQQTEATLLAPKLQDQVQSLLKQCTELWCTTLPCPVVLVVQEH